MDKFEYKVRADEIKELIARGEYSQAAEIADTIDWRRVKNVMMLCTISDLYKINRRYEDARDLLYLAYDRRPGGKTICYSLCELCIKTEEFVQAVNFYKEFVQIAPKDPGRYVLQYKLYEAQDVGLEERIGVLEELKKRDYREKWAYELAYLYHRVGLATRCVEECDELILWFGEGKYVIKAMELKMLHEPLTEVQQQKYDARFGKAPVQQAEYYEQPAEEQAYEQTPEGADAAPQEAAEQQEDIQVKTVDVGEYNTINLQAEIARGLSQVLTPEQTAEPTQEQVSADDITRSIIAPMLDSDTESLDMPAIDEVDESDLEPEREVMESSEVFFGETGDMGAAQAAVASAPEGMEEIFLPEEDEETTEGTVGEEASVETVTEEAGAPEEMPADDAIGSVDGTDEAETTDTTADAVKETMRREVVYPSETSVLTSNPPKELAGVLSQESDGQIRLVVPERESVEKQITGQMNISDILLEWEQMKIANEERRREEVRQHVLQQTGAMFTEFEASVRDGLLEQLENGEDVDVDAALAGVTAETTDTEEESTAEEAEITETEIPEAEEAVADTVAAAGVAVMEAEIVAEGAEAVADAIAEGEYTETEGEYTEAEGEYIEAEGEYTEAEGEYTEAEGEYTEAEGEYTEAEGEYIETEGEYTEAEGEYTEAEGEYTEAEGEYTEAEGEYIEAEGEYTEAEGEYTETEGEYTEAEGEYYESEDGTVDYGEVEEIAEIEEVSEADAEPTETPAETPGAAEQPEEAVSSNRAKARALTREEKELYGEFIQSRSDREKFARAIDGISLASYTGNIIITGEEGTDTLTLAKNMIREIQMTDSNFSGKVAKISGRGLNGKDVEETLGHLNNGALIIEKASELNQETIAKLYKLIQQENRGIIIILEDTKKGIGKLLAAHPELTECFTSRIDLESLSNDALVEAGKKYAREMEYSIDDFGILALHTRIEELQTIDHAVSVAEVQEIVDEAIRHANRRTPKHFFDILFGKRYDDEDMIILTEKDFA